MARQPGLNNFAGTLEVLAGGPLDARTVVATKTDLTTSGTFAYAYVGMIVSVEADGKVYVLTDLDYTNEDNWRSIGESGGDDGGVVIGYYDSSTFYLDKEEIIGQPTTYKNPVTPDETKLYIDKDYYTTYIYSGLQYEVLDPWHEYSAMPDPIPINSHLPKYYVGKIVQYLGAENYPVHNFKTGYYYECILDPADNTQFTWVQKDVQPHGVPQFTEMPSNFGQYGSNIGDIVQYIGATDANFTNGYFYKCVNDGVFTSWAPIDVQDGGGSTIDNIIEGYFNHANNLFYEDSSFITPIAGEDKTLYISIDTNRTYRYNGTIFVRLDEETFDNIQKMALPDADSTNLGTIYQYIGFTNQNYVNGYFYKCIEDSSTPGAHIWSQLEVQPDNDTTIQVSSMPTVTSADNGRIVQYIGATDTNYTNGYFYKCVESSTTPGTYVWEAVQVQEGGGSGSGSLGRAITAAIDVGGIDTGDTFAQGTSYDDMWDALLNPTLYPTFTAPSASISYSADTYYEVKSTISAKTATESLNRGSITPAYGTSGYRSGAATGYALASSGADTEYSDSNSSGTFSVPALTRSTKGNIVLTATVSYAAGEQPKDSKGNNYDSPLPAGSKTASKTMQFIQAYFYGKSSTPTISNFTGLSKSVTAKGEKKFKYTTNNEYMVIAYDASYGNLKTILDPNSFDVTSGWTKSTLTVDGFNYYVYVANSPTTDTDAQFTFKY